MQINIGHGLIFILCRTVASSYLQGIARYRLVLYIHPALLRSLLLENIKFNPTRYRETQFALNMFNLTFDIYLLTCHIYHLTLSMTFGMQASIGFNPVQFVLYFTSKSLTLQLDWVSQSVGF